MADRLSGRRLIGVVNNGTGSARIDATEAEKKASQALIKAEEALELINTLDVNKLNTKLDAEIMRSTTEDLKHDEAIAIAATIEIIDTEISPINENFWTKPNEEDNN